MLDFPCFWNIHKRQAALDYLRENMTSFWAGNDFCLVKETIIPIGFSNVSVVFKKEHLPDDFPVQYFLGWATWFRTSTRSCYAQVGISILKDVWTSFSEEEYTQLHKNGSVQISIPVFNHGWVKVKIPAWTWFWRLFFYKWNWLSGDTIDSFFQSWDIVLENSVYGKEYWYIDTQWNKLSYEDRKKSSRLRIKLTDFRRFPEYPEILVIESKKSIVKIFDTCENLSPWDERNIIIGETPFIRLSANVALIIEETFQENNSLHIKSPLIDQKFEWPIRTEICNSGSADSYITCMVIWV